MTIRKRQWKDVSGTEREIREELLEADDSKGGGPGETPTFADFADRFMETYATTNNKPSEIESKRMILRVHLLPAFGKLPLDQIGAPQIEEYKAQKLRAELARKTVNNHLTVLRKILSTAGEWGLLPSVPPIKWLKLPPPEFDFLTFEEADALIEAAQEPWRTMIVVGLRTGLRLSELLGLRWIDVDLENGRIIVRQAVVRGVVGTPKNGRTREVPLSDQAAAVLRAHPRLGPLVFCEPDGSMLSKNKTKWPLWRSCRAAGLRQIGWHMLRHTFASHLVMRGAPIRTVQELLGHSTIEMTTRYSHLSPDARRGVVKLLDIKDSVTLVWKTSKGAVCQPPTPAARSTTVPTRACPPTCFARPRSRRFAGGSSGRPSSATLRKRSLRSEGSPHDHSDDSAVAFGYVSQ